MKWPSSYMKWPHLKRERPPYSGAITRFVDKVALFVYHMAPYEERKASLFGAIQWQGVKCKVIDPHATQNDPVRHSHSRTSQSPLACFRLVSGANKATLVHRNWPLLKFKMRKALNCPVCMKENLKRLSNLLASVHGLSGHEKREILKEARKSYQYNSLPQSLLEFFISLQKIPSKFREFQMLYKNRQVVQTAWQTNSIDCLPENVLAILESSYNRWKANNA